MLHLFRLLSTTPALIHNLSREADWFYDMRTSSRKAGQVHTYRAKVWDLLLLTGIGMSTALSALNVGAWFAALKYGATVQFAGDSVHFTDLCAHSTVHQKAVFADELGVGAALLTAQHALQMRYFADTEWFLAGKPVKPVSLFSAFSGHLVSTLETPDFVILDEAGNIRLLEAKGTFGVDCKKQLKKGKSQVRNVMLTGGAVESPQVSATMFPSSPLQAQRPLTILLDPKSNGLVAEAPAEDVKRYFYSKVLAFLGFQADGLRLLQHRQVEDIADALRAALSFPEMDTLPLLDLGDGYTFIIARTNAEELYRLSFGAETLPALRRGSVFPEDRVRTPWTADVLPIGFGITARLKL